MSTATYNVRSRVMIGAIAVCLCLAIYLPAEARATSFHDFYRHFVHPWGSIAMSWCILILCVVALAVTWPLFRAGSWMHRIGAKYERPLEEALLARHLGVVTGGGIQMSRDGSSVEWVVIDIDLANLDGALDFTRETLRHLGAPPGSVLEYRVGDQKKMVEIA